MSSEKVDVYVGVHKGLRRLISQFLYQTGAVDWTDEAAVQCLKSRWETVTRVLQSHHQHEEWFIHPVLERVVPGGHRSYGAEHRAQEIVLGDLDAHLQRLVGGRCLRERRAELGLEFYRGLNLFYADYLRHLHREEVDADRALASLCSQEELRQMVSAIIASIPPDEMMIYIDCMFPAMNHAERAGLLADMKAAASPVIFQRLVDRIRGALDEADWTRLQEAVGF